MILNEKEIVTIKKKLYDYIDKSCIFRCEPNTKYNYCSDKGFITPKGTKNKNYSYQFYMRRLTHNPIALEWVSLLFLNDLIYKIKNNEEYKNIQLAGLETGSLPLLSALQMVSIKYNIYLNCFSVRKERKSYGLFNYIEGIPNDNYVILIDDLINSGRTFYKCYDVIKHELGNKLAKNSYCIVDIHDERTHIELEKDVIIQSNYIFKSKEFDKKYNKEKYWFPKDCDKTYNKRPEYF